MGLSKRISPICIVAATFAAAAPGWAGEPTPAPVKLAVYGFELKDFSAGGGIIAPDQRDATYLGEATEEAKRQLAQSGRFALVDMSPAQDDGPVKTHQMTSCDKCIGPITRKLGADQAVIGTITRINRTEYTLLIQFFDAQSGEPVANYYTSLRMGANYAWPRGVTWLMRNRILAEHASH
ncbi:MAG: DUF2380 domain-containing protein [Hyphomicrobium sp.]